MDHRVSKDMISSGMIPSGEKKKEDLGRTQYGSAPSPSSLADAYKSMYDKKEETLNEHHKKDADGNTIPHEDEEIEEGAGLYANIHAKRKRGGKMRKKGDKGAPSSQDFANAAKTAKEEVDKFDVVYNHFISEGYSEKEAYSKMANLTEEQLDEFLKALAQAGMRGAQSVGKATKGIATKVAQQGQQLNKIEKNIPKPQGPVRPTAQKGVDAPKPGSTGFKPSTPSEVVSNAAAMRRKRMEKEMEPKKGEVMQDEYQHQIDEAPMLATAALGLVKKIATKQAVKKLAGNVATGAAMSAGSNLMSGGGGGQQNQKASTVSASADLFDIVKGQLLDEGLSEEEIRDIMLTLTPDEILKEIEESSMSAGSSGGNYSDGGDGVFRSKEQVGRQFNKNFPPAKNGKVDKPTRKAINTSAKDFGIQGPSTLKQSVEPEGETI